MSLKFILLLAFAILGARSDDLSKELEDITSGEAVEVLKAVIALGYEADKLGTFSEIAHEFASEKVNISIVAWQNVVDKEGHLEEIRTLSLHLPTFGSTSKLQLIEEDNDEEEDIDVSFNEIVTLFEALSSIGLPMEVSHIGFNKTGEITEGFYLDVDTVYYYDGELAYLNQTLIVHDENPIKEMIKRHSHEIVPVAVLKHDAHGHFVEKDSILVPELYVYIEDEENATEEMLKATIEVVGKASLYHYHEQHEIPKAISQHLKQKFPTYVFHVTTDIDGYYINKDVYMEAKYELTSFDEEPLVFHIFGVELHQSNKN